MAGGWAEQRDLLKMKSNIYLDLRIRHINNLVKKNSMFALIGMICWAGYMFQLIIQFPSLATVNILR